MKINWEIVGLILLVVLILFDIFLIPPNKDSFGDHCCGGYPGTEKDRYLFLHQMLFMTKNGDYQEEAIEALAGWLEEIRKLKERNGFDFEVRVEGEKVDPEEFKKSL